MTKSGDNTEFEYEENDDNQLELKEAQVRQYYVTRERQSYSFLTSSLKKHTFYNLLINNILYLCVT